MFIAQAALLLAVAAPLPASSPVASPAPSATPQTIGTVVTTAERKATPLSSTPQTTYVVTRAQIEADGDQTIADAIRTVPGVTYFQYGGFGAQATYGTLGSLQSIVLLDGLPITEGSTGSIDLGTLSSNDVERIEVVESGGSTLYGSGGAGGVINIITAVPRETYLFASYGSYGDRDVRISTGNGTIGISFERHTDTNDYPYAAQGGLPAGVRDNAQALQTDGSIDYGQTVGPYTIRATARFSQLDLGVPGPVAAFDGVSELSPSEFDPTNRNDLFASIARTDGKFTTSLTVSGFHAAVYDNGTDGLGPEDSIVDARTNVALQETVVEADRTTLVAGVDLSRESSLDVLGQDGPPPSFTAAQSQSAVYAQQTVGIGPAGKVYAGLRAENDTPAGGTLEPAGGFLFPVGPVRIAGNAAASFIVPTLFDLYYPGFSNPNLLPERDRNLNLVVSGDPGLLAPTLTIFDRTSSNLIEDNANFVPVNAGRAHFQGATLSIAPKIMRQLVTQFSVTDIPTATQVTNGVAGRVDDEPVLQGTISIEHPIANSSLGYGLVSKLVGAHVESYTGPGTFGQYSDFDAYVRARLSPRAVLTARVDDIGDEHFSTFSSYPVPARTYRLEISTR